jgi:hypothetical protein
MTLFWILPTGNNIQTRVCQKGRKEGRKDRSACHQPTRFTDPLAFSPSKSVILKYDLLLVFQKRHFCLYTKRKCQFDKEVHLQKQSYWTWLGFYIQKQSYKWHTQSRLLLSD